MSDILKKICDVKVQEVAAAKKTTALADVRRSITFCQQLKMQILGVVENMSGFACPHCKTVTDIFKSGGGESLAAEYGVPFLGRIPLDPAIGIAGDDGKPFIYHYSKTATAEAFVKVIAPLLELP